MLEKFFPEIYNIASPLFRIYRKTYSQVIEEQDIKEVKDGVRKIMAIVKEKLQISFEENQD
jgi:hypothetical protein